MTEVTKDESGSLFQNVALERVILQNRAEVDQEIEGLQSLQVHSAMVAHSNLLEPCFVTTSVEPNAGKC